jgi:hypothetical protein
MILQKPHSIKNFGNPAHERAHVQAANSCGFSFGAKQPATGDTMREIKKIHAVVDNKPIKI